MSASRQTAAEPPSLKRSLLTGACGFGLASLCVFATVTFAERWMYRRLGVLGAYLTWIALFILLGGTVLGSLVSGRWRLPRFYLIFGGAFLVYGAGWVSAYFASPGLVGEWLGSLFGSILMSVVLALGFGALKRAPLIWLLLLAANSTGYFFGSSLNDLFHGKTGMLLWGLVYGLSLGAGLGATLYFVQKSNTGPASGSALIGR